MDIYSASLSGNSLPKNVNLQHVSGEMEAAENLQLSCSHESQKDIEECKPCELPPELWIQIFRYLPQYQLFKTLRLVCKKWRDMIEGPDVWRIIEFKAKVIKQPLLLYLSARNENVQSLNLSGSSITCNGLSFALKQMPSLKKLSLGYCICLNCGNQPDRISTYEQYMSFLMNYTVRTPYVLVPNEGVSSWTLADIGQYCSQITCLDLTGQQKLTNDALQAIACGCKHLTHLCLMACRPFSRSGIDAIADNCTSLRELNLDLVLGYIFYSLDLERLAKGCPKLESLSLRGIKGKGQAYADHLLKLANFKNLIFLNLFSLEAVNDDVIINLAKHFKKLQRLNLSKTRIHDAAVKALAIDAPCLQHVALEGANVTLACLCYMCHIHHKRGQLFIEQRNQFSGSKNHYFS